MINSVSENQELLVLINGQCSNVRAHRNMYIRIRRLRTLYTCCPHNVSVHVFVNNIAITSLSIIVISDINMCAYLCINTVRQPS